MSNISKELQKVVGQGVYFLRLYPDGRVSELVFPNDSMFAYER